MSCKYTVFALFYFVIVHDGLAKVTKVYTANEEQRKEERREGTKEGRKEGKRREIVIYL